MSNFRVFGTPEFRHLKAAESAAFHSRNLYMAVMDNTAMWDPATLDKIVEDFPKKLLTMANIYLLLAECVANAAVHAKAEALALFVRRNRKVLLLSFFQDPPVSEHIGEVLRNAREGKLPDYFQDELGGLGIPILMRIARRVTISADRTRLQLWFRI